MDIKRLVGMNIRAARKARGLTQLQLAERSGLSADFIGKVEGGTTSPSIDSLKHIADALQTSLHDLFAGEGMVSSSQEALTELLRLCRDHRHEEIELIVGIAEFLFQWLQRRPTDA